MLSVCIFPVVNSGCSSAGGIDANLIANPKQMLSHNETNIKNFKIEQTNRDRMRNVYFFIFHFY